MKKKKEFKVCIVCNEEFLDTKRGGIKRYCSRECCDKSTKIKMELNRIRYYENSKKKWKKEKLQVYKHYGLKCNCCGEKEYKFLTIDHIYGGGQKHRRELGSVNNSRALRRWLIDNNFPKGFQLLCYNCNITKGLYGECPHKSNI